MIGQFFWNGTGSSSFGIGITNYPNYKTPARKVDVYSVPGRNGDIIIQQDAWENVEQQYEIAFGDGTENSVPADLPAISTWLNSPTGYCELYDTFDPDHFRLAHYKGGADIRSLALGRAGKVTISFDCKPQKYLRSGQTAIAISGTSSIENPTAYASRPLIRAYVSGTSGGTITIGETVLTLTSTGSNGAWIDCEEMRCYNYNGTTETDYTLSSNTNDFAKLNPGANAIGFTGAITSLAITPRWFEI